MAAVGHTYKHMALMMLSHRHNVMYIEAVLVVYCSLKLVTFRYIIGYILQHVLAYASLLACMSLHEVCSFLLNT
jgi:hypothetical protein